MALNLSLLRRIDTDWQVQIKPYINSDALIGLERCESGPCEDLVDKNSPPIKEN